jgi:hypothetical protein
MPEHRRKVSTASAFLPVVSCLSPASVFRHQGTLVTLVRLVPLVTDYSGITQLCEI